MQSKNSLFHWFQEHLELLIWPPTQRVTISRFAADNPHLTPFIRSYRAPA